MSIHDVLNEMTDEDRNLYLSAQSVKDSPFWIYLMEQLDAEAIDANQTLVTKTMEGKEKESVIAACRIQIIGLVMGIMEGTLAQVQMAALNQEQEE